jgi:hypothetical protein
LPSGLQSWSVAPCPFSIEYPVAMMNRLRTVAMDAFFAIPRGGVEIGGILFGTIELGRVRLQAFRAVECEHASGPSFILSDPDRARLAALLVSAPEERELAGLTPVGWFRSRTRSEISLSEADVALFDQYFPQSRQVVLVLRPEVGLTTRAGFFFREQDGALRVESSYSEFLLDGEVDSPCEPPRPPMELKFLEAAATRRPHARPMWIFALCISLAAASLAAREYLTAPVSTVDPFVLEVMDRGGQLQFQWDRSARPVRQARGAKLEITDGAELLWVDLKAAQLQKGSFYYTRATDRVDIHMTILGTDGASTDEYAVFCGRLPPPDSEPRQ